MRRNGRLRARTGRLALLLVAGLGAACAAPPAAPPVSAAPLPPPSGDDGALAWRIAAAKGWAPLIERLVGDGLAGDRVARAFADPRVPAFEGLAFSVEPRESRELYAGVLRERSLAGAAACRSEHAAGLEAAERTHGVPAGLVAAILWVETRCGANTGRSRVLPALARLAMAEEPSNVDRNLLRQATQEGVEDPELAARVRERARWLADTFYPEVRASFEVADRLGLDPLELLGSPSGAFGLPQFLPTSYLRDGEDGDGDGRVDLFDPADAAASVARYLAARGWRAGLLPAEERQVVWTYNHSEPYVETVLSLAAWLWRPAAPGEVTAAEASQ
jgi:membrane-bound lytic murein transglycosylase B